MSGRRAGYVSRELVGVFVVIGGGLIQHYLVRLVHCLLTSRPVHNKYVAPRRRTEAVAVEKQNSRQVFATQAASLKSEHHTMAILPNINHAKCSRGRAQL